MSTATEPSGGDRDTTQLPAGITLVGSELRSTNLERDVRDPHLNAPYIGARALDVLDRVTNAVADSRRTRAWSFTGPYGSGKSTLANLLDAFLGHDPDRQAEAYAAVEATSPGLADRLSHAREQRDSEGFLGAVATARREPLAATVHRALRTAADRKWVKGRRRPAVVTRALKACAAREVPSAEDLLDAVTALCETAPLLLIIDEFGKSLEYLAGVSDSGDADSDVFLLQMLAERGAGRSGQPLFILTLQHLAFSDYAARSSTTQLQEWAKVQGRFEDITFSPNLGDAVHLLLRRLDHSGVQEPGRALIARQAQAAAQTWTHHGLKSVVNLTPEMFAGLYPLHPLTAIAAPILASQIGQHDRSLVGFLANDEPNTVRRTIDAHQGAAPAHASTIRLPQLYDYFFASGRTTVLASVNASRWLEVDDRLNEAHGLSQEDQDVLKTIGILNLIDADGALRATPAMVQFALHDPDQTPDPAGFAELEAQLGKLESSGFLVCRAYNNEYRVWRGTDIDIDERVKEIAVRIGPSDVVEFFSRHLGNVLPADVVAGAHSQRTGMLRHFHAAVSHQTEKLDGPGVVEDAADGLIIYHLGAADSLPLINSPLPVLIGATDDPAAILDAGITLVALRELLQDATIDHVAAREIEERAAELSQSISIQLDEAFNPRSAKATWRLWRQGTDTSAVEGDPIPARGYAGLVSTACDRVYPHTPEISNEMAGRHELTSNGARTRREVLTAMIQRSGLPALGFDLDRYSPERAMYAGVVEYLGLHRLDREARGSNDAGSINTHGISRPDPQRNPSVMPVWTALEEALTSATRMTPITDVYQLVMAPPYGTKAGVVPILVVAALILRAGDIALFEDGSYCPRLTPEIAERLSAVDYPERFAIKATPVGGGQRGLVVEQLMSGLGVGMPRSHTARNPQLLAVTRAMLERIMVLDPYARQTRRLSSPALKLRDILAGATDPDELIFTSLPKVVGFEPIQPSAPEDPQRAEAFASGVVAALDELSNAKDTLRQEVTATLGREFGLPAELAAFRAGLVEKLRGFADAPLDDAVLRGFVQQALSEVRDNDADWLDPIIVQLTNKALGDWTDRDIEGLTRIATERARALDRVSHLYAMRSVPEPRNEKGSVRQLEPVLVTLTTEQGTEGRALIHVPTQKRQATQELLVSVIRQAEDKLGHGGARILLAALAEHVAATDSNRDPQGMEMR